MAVALAPFMPCQNSTVVLPLAFCSTSAPGASSAPDEPPLSDPEPQAPVSAVAATRAISTADVRRSRENAIANPFSGNSTQRARGEPADDVALAEDHHG